MTKRWVGRQLGAWVAALLLGCGGASQGCSGCGEACPEGMVHVPGGSFLMGEGDPMQAFGAPPAHQETVGPYCIDRTEVTAGAYHACTDPACGAVEIGTCADGVEHPQYPRNCVTWQQADAYCRWRGGRLPTETEWEFAARGADGRLYPWGHDEPDDTRARWGGAHGLRRLYTAPVGSFPAGASPFGVLDMSGNVSEWVSDATREGRLVRGSAYDATRARYLAVTERHQFSTDVSPVVGFRCVADP
ncbi:MAG: SUMF1/EgtB/PvdO family nonheme iron enzyme [Sandaracinaceae bacterium]|nr:SUMF1/EgtB/PvdO family nonheme iron enzyme [Sandaracinaceae bacterium]